MLPNHAGFCAVRHLRSPLTGLNLPAISASAAHRTPTPPPLPLPAGSASISLSLPINLPVSAHQFVHLCPSAPTYVSLCPSFPPDAIRVAGRLTGGRWSGRNQGRSDRRPKLNLHRRLIIVSRGCQPIPGEHGGGRRCCPLPSRANRAGTSPAVRGGTAATEGRSEQSATARLRSSATGFTQRIDIVTRSHTSRRRAGNDGEDSIYGQLWMNSLEFNGGYYGAAKEL